MSCSRLRSQNSISLIDANPCERGRSTIEYNHIFTIGYARFLWNDTTFENFHLNDQRRWLFRYYLRDLMWKIINNETKMCVSMIRHRVFSRGFFTVSPSFDRYRYILLLGKHRISIHRTYSLAQPRWRWQMFGQLANWLVRRSSNIEFEKEEKTMQITDETVSLCIYAVNHSNSFPTN